MDETLTKVKQIISMLFNVEEDELTLESSTSTVPEWDSMGQLMLVLELEQQFDIQIPPEASDKLTSIAAIVALVDGTSV
jgi:acyl carrier protein